MTIETVPSKLKFRWLINFVTHPNTKFHKNAFHGPQIISCIDDTRNFTRCSAGCESV